MSLQQALDLWWWIDRLQEKYHDPPEKYDKHLLNKIEKVESLLEGTDWGDGKEGMRLRSYVQGRIDGTGYHSRRTRNHASRMYDLVKAVIHNDILRKNHIEPLRGEKKIKTQAILLT